MDVISKSKTFYAIWIPYPTQLHILISASPRARSATSLSRTTGCPLKKYLDRGRRQKHGAWLPQLELPFANHIPVCMNEWQLSSASFPVWTSLILENEVQYREMKVSWRKKPNAGLKSAGKITRKLSLTKHTVQDNTKAPCSTSYQQLLLFSIHKIHQYFPKQGMKLVIFHPTLHISLLNQKLLVQRKNHAWGHYSTLGLFVQSLSNCWNISDWGTFYHLERAD